MLTTQHDGIYQLIYGLVSFCALTLAVPVQADTLSSNVSAAVYYTDIASGDSYLAASFATGSSEYQLTNAGLMLQADTPETAQLELYSDLKGQPGTRIGTLAAPGSYSSTLSLASFGGNNLLLSPDTSYWLVLSSASGTFEWAYTESNTGSGVGFNHTWGSSDDAAGTWFTSDIEPMIMSVDASAVSSPVPEPGSSGLLLAMGSVFSAVFFRKRGIRLAGESR